MEIECDLASIRDEDLLRKMWQQSEDFGRKKEIRSHLYKLRESRLREFYSTGGPGGGDIMNPSTDLCFGKTPLTPSHGDSLVDQSFQSLKSKEVRDSESPLREIKFRNSGGVAGGVLVPDTTGWNVQTSSEVSPDGRAFRTETLAKTDGVEKVPGGRAEFAGRNEQKSSASHQGDDKNFVKKAAESSKTHLQENIVVGDANSGRTEMKSSSVTSSSSKVVSSSSQVISSGDPGFDMEPRRLTHDPQYQKLVSSANNTALHSDQQQYQRSERNERNERNETTKNLREESMKYVDMDKASPEYQQHVQHLMSQPGAIVSNIVEYPKPGVKMITTVKKLPDGTTVKTKRYETEASADSGSISQTMNQQQRTSSSSSTTQKTSEKRIQDSEDVFSRLSRTRDSSGPVSPQKTPETPSQGDIYSRLQKSRGGNVNEQKFSETVDQRSTQILRDTNQHPVTRTVPTRHASDLVDNVEVVSTNKTVKKDLNQSSRNEKVTDFIQTERDRFVLDRDSPSRSGPEGFPDALAPITPSRFVRPQTEDISTNGFTSTGVIQQSSKSSTKFSESRRFSTETVESFAESHNENQDFSTHGFPSVRKPIEEPRGGRSPSGGRPSQDFSTHGFPSVKSDKPTQQYTSQRPSTHDEHSTTERVHIVNTERPGPGETHPQATDSTSTTRSNFSTNETRRHVTSTTDDFSTHGFPSVRAGTPTRDSPKRFEASPSESPRRPSGQEPVVNRRSPSDGYSTHGFPSVKANSPTGDSPRHHSVTEPTTHGFPSAKPGHATPNQSAPQYEDSPQTANRRQPSVDRDDTISVSSDRSNSLTYEKRIDAAHQAFARSLRCASPVESIRRDSISDRTTPRTSVGSIRNSYSPSKRDGRSPSHESVTNSESSRISSATVTKTHRPITTDTRRVSGPKSPISKTAPSHVANEMIDYSLTRKITAKPMDKTTGKPAPVHQQSVSAEPILRKKIFAATEGFLASEGIAEEPILKKEQYYQLGPSDATLPSSRLKNRQLLGTTPNTSRRPYNTEDEINTLLDTATKHTTPTTTRSAKTQDTKPTKPDTLYSSKPKTKPQGYVSQNRATEITEKHNQTTNKQVSYPHYIPSAPKADRSSPSDRPTKNASSPAPTTTSTTPHTAPKSATDKPKVAPSTSPTTKPSSSSPSTRFTKTVKVENGVTRDTTKTRRREPEEEYLPEDLDEGYVPDTKGQRRPTSKRPTSDDEGFEPESPRAGSPTSDFEYRRPTQTETYDEEDSLFKKTRKTDKKTVTTDFLDTERGVTQTRRPEDGNRPSGPTDSEPEDGWPSGVKQPKRPVEGSPKPTQVEKEPTVPSGVKQPRRPGDGQPVVPLGPNEPRRPDDGGRRPHNLTDDTIGPHANQPRHPGDVNEPNRPEDKGRTPKRPEDEPNKPGKPRGSKPPLDRSETYDERCRQILGMEDETTVEKTNRVQNFINTERDTVFVTHKPGQRSPSPQKKQPSDTVSIEDCDDEDYPSQNTTTRTTKTTKVEYPRGTSPTEKPVSRGPKPGDKKTGDHPRDRSPVGKTPKGTRPNEIDETTVTTTTKSVDRPRGGLPTDGETTVRKTTTRDTTVVDEIDERSLSSRPRDGSPFGRNRKPTQVDETTVRETTSTIKTVDERTPSARPRTGSPVSKKPLGTRPTDTTYGVDRPRDKSPLKEPVRGSSPTDETITSRTTTRDTTTQEFVDDVYGPRSPTDKLRSRSPSDDTTVKRTTTTTRDTTINDRYPRERSPTDKPRGGSPTDNTTFRRTTKTTRDTTIVDDLDDRSPSSRPRGQSPNEKPRDDTTLRTITTTTRDILIDDDSLRPRDYPRDRSPTQKPRGPGDSTVKNITKTTKTTTVISDVDKRPRDRSPSEKPKRGPRPTYEDDSPTETTSTKGRPRDRSPTETDTEDRPRSQSPSDKPRRQTPIDTDNIDETYVQKTTRTTKGTTIVNEFDVDDRAPQKKPTRRPSPTEETDTEDHPRGKSPIKPKGGRPSEAYETTVTDETVVEERRKRPGDRSPSPRSKHTDNYPREPRPTDGETSPRDRSPTGKKPTSTPRGTSPSDKPRRRYPNDDTEETIVQRTTKTTRDKTTFEETDVEDYPRNKSPSGKPRGPRPTEETVVITITDRTTTNDRSPKGSPRATSPTEKPGRRQPTDEENDVTVVQRTTKTTKEEINDRSPKDRYPDNRPRGTSPSEKPTPRGQSPTEKPRGPGTTDETVIQRTVKKTTDITNRSPKASPRGSSPTEKPRRRQPTDEQVDTTLVQKTSKVTKDRTTLEETVVKDRSPKDFPRQTSPKRRQPSEGDTDDTITSECNDRPRGTSPTDKTRRRRPSEEETDETFIQRTVNTTTDTTTNRSSKDRPRGTSPTEKPRRRQPTDEEIDVTVVQRTTKTTKDRKTFEKSPVRSPKDHPRDRSPSGPRPTDKSTSQRTVKTITVDDRLPKGPRGNSPSEKPRGPRNTDQTVVRRTVKSTTDRTTVEDRSPNRPRGTSPSEKPRRRRPSDDEDDETITETTTIDSVLLTDRPRGTSPSEKPRRRQPSDEEIDVTLVQRTTKTTKDRTTLEETTERSPKDRPREKSPSEKPGSYPRDRSPTEKPRGPRPTSEKFVERTVKTTTDRTTVDDCLPKDRPRGTSPSEKPRRRQPTDEEIDTTVVQRTTKTTKGRTTLEETTERSPKDRPREKSPSEKPGSYPRDRSPTEKPRGARPTSEKFVERTVKTTTDRTTVDDRSPKNRPRGTSPSEKPRRRQPSDEEIDITLVQRTTKRTKDRTTLEETRDRSPSEKPGSRTYPRDRSPTETVRGPRPTNETVVQRTVKETTDSITVDDRSPRDRPRGTSPSEKPRRRRPSEEDTDETVTQTTVETTTFKGERPHGQSPSEKPNSRSYPRETSPFQKPQRPTHGDIDETVILTTFTTTQDQTFVDRYPEVRPRSPSGKPRGPNDSPRGTSPSDKPRGYRPSDEETEESYVRRTTKTTRDDHPRDRSTTGKPASKVYPRDDSPTDQPRRPKTTDVDETTVRSTKTRTTVQETDFEKRYPKGRPREKSPVDKPTTRRPSKPTNTSTTTTTTTRNRSTLEEQDLSRSPRPKTQPATRDKAPTKTTPTYPRSQPTTERRVPAELPTTGRKPTPKTTFGSTTKTTTQTTVTRVPATRPKTTKDQPKKPTKLTSGPSDSRPGARQTERKHSPSISPDSSPSRPTSEVDLQSPYHSLNTSPSRKSPSPTRSVKLEDITSSVVTTKKTTVSIDKSKPKVTHITTAKFEVSPPTSPTKVISSPELKPSPSKKSPTKVSTPKPTVSRVTTTKKTTTVHKDEVIATDSERDSEVPTDLEDVDSPLSQRTSTRKLPVTHRKESAPVHRVTQVDRDVQKMARSTSENIIKTPVIKRPLKNEPLEPISQGKTSPKTERRPSKHLSTKTINLTTFDKVINSQDMEDVMVIDIQHAKSSREPSPNKIVPTPVSVDLYTGKPRYPDNVQEPEEEPRKKPTVKNIPIFEEETNDFVGCQITEVNESFENTTKHRTRKFIDGESQPQRPTPIIVTGDNVDNECLLSVHDKVSKFISTAEEVSRPKTSAPFRRDVPEEDVPEDDECLLTVDEKVNKFLKTAESVTKEVVTSTPKPIERPRIDDLDEDLRTDECVLSVSEKVNKFTTKAKKLAPSAPQRSPELVARIERQISRQSEPEPESPVGGYPESPDDEDSPTTVRKVKQTKSLFEREEKKYTDRQIDILSRPSVWEKKPKPEVKLDDILGYKPDDKPVEGAPRRRSPVKDQPDEAFSRPSKPVTDTISKRKEMFENKTSTHKTTSTTKPAPRSPTYSRKTSKPSDESDSRYPGEFTPKYDDSYPQEPDDVHEDVYGSSKTRRLNENETSTFETTRIRQSSERSPTRKSSHPEIRPSPRTTSRTPKQPEDHSPSRRYSDDHSPRHPTDLYKKTSETSEYTARRRSSTQKYPEDHSSKRRTPHDNTPSPSRKQPVDEPEDYTFSSMREETNKHHTTRTSYRSPKDTTPLTPTSIPDDEDHDHSPARSTSTVSSQKRTTTHRSTSNRLTEDTTSRRPRRPSGNEPSTPTSLGRAPRSKGVPETVAARRNIFESSPGDVSPRPGNRRPSYMDHTKSSLEHTRRDSLEITKTNYSRKSSMEEEPYEPSPRSAVKFGVGLKHKEEPKPKRKLSSSDIPNVEDVFELDLLEEMLNIVTLYEQRRRIRAQIRVVKKLLETKTKEEVSKMTKITTFRKTSSSSIRDSPIPRRDTSMRPDRYQPSDDIDSESIVESRHVEEREETIRERSISPQTKTTKKITKVTEVRRIAEPTAPKRTAPKKDEPKDSKPIWATKNILKKPSENEKVARVLSAKKTTSTSSSSTSRTQQTNRQRVPADEDCITSSYGIGPTDDDGRPLFGIRALKKKATTTSKTAQPSETTKVTGTVITEKYYSENGAEPVGERKVTVYSTNPEDLVDMETQYDRRDSETVKREKLSKDGLTSVTKVQKIGKYKPGEIPALTDDDEFSKSTSKMVRRGSVKEMSEKFIHKESSSSVTEKSSGYPKAGLILRTRTNSGATADAADQYEVRAKSTEYDDESDNECDVEIRTSRKHSKVVTESEDETEIRRKVNTRSFLNSGGSKVTGVDDVLDRMRNADNVVVDGDTLEDREARSLLNKFLGASVLMTGMESIIPQKDLRRGTAADNLKKQGVKTTRVTKTIKSAAAGGSSSSPVARETCDFEEIWDEETLKELLEKSTSYEERRSIRARLRQLMADREACAELVASVKAELDTEKNVKTAAIADDESSCSEYEEIVEEYTASESEEDEETTTTTAINTVADKKKEEVKDETKIKKITEEVKKTTITKKQEPPKQSETKKTIVVEKTIVVKKDATPSSVEDKKLDTKATADDDDNNEASVSDNSKGESLLIPLLQGLLHKNMPQARSSSSTSKTATTTTTTTAIANQNSNNLKSSLKNNSKHLSSASSNNNNSLGDSGLSSEVSKNSSLGQGGTGLRVTAQQIEDSGTESGEDLRLIAAGIRDSMQIEGIEDQSDMSLIKEVTNALNRLESSLKEGNDLSLDNSKKNALLALVERLQTGLTAPHKLSGAAGEQDFPEETSSPEADNHRSNRQRFAKRKNRNNRHTVGVSKEELADARRYMEEMVMIENLSNCTTPECNAATTPPQLFTIQKQPSMGAILSNHDSQEASSSLFRPNQFVPSNLKHSTEAGSSYPDVQLRTKKGTPAPGQRQSAAGMEYMNIEQADSSSGKRPLSDSYDSYTAQNNRVTFSDTKQPNESYVQDKNQYNRTKHTDNQPDLINRMSPDSSRFNRFNNKKQMMKRANTIDIPKTHRYNPEFDTDSEVEEKSSFNVKGLRGTVQVSVKRRPRQVVPNFEPKTENDHKFLAFIQKQNAAPGLGWNSSKSVSNWTNKFGNIKNVFESGSSASNSNRSQVPSGQGSSAKSFWKKADEHNPPKVSSSVLTSALRAKERNEQRSEVVAPKPVHMNQFIHNPQSAFRPIDSSPETTQIQFKPIPVERPVNIVNSFSPTKSYNPVSSRKQAIESPSYPHSPTKSWVKKNTATNSPVSLPWAVKPPENSVLKMAASKFESKSPLNVVQRHHSFKEQIAQKRPSLPNAAQPYQYQNDVYGQQSYSSISQPASYAEYVIPRVVREDSLTNPNAEPLVLTPNKPAYSPSSLQPFDYYADALNSNFPQADMTDDDIDDLESMTEYRVEAKVMGKPVSQQAVTVGNRTAHMSDDEVFGKNSRAAKSLLSVMKNIGNSGPEKVSKKVERNIAPSTCMSPDGRAYQAPIVEPLFPEVTKFEVNRLPEYIGPKPHKSQQQEQTVEYQKNPAYVPLVDYHHQQPPVAPPRGRKVSQEAKNFPQERPNVYPQPRREAPNSLPLKGGPTSPPTYVYNSPLKTPESAAYTSQASADNMYLDSGPNFRQQYSGPSTPDDYSSSREAYHPMPAPRTHPVQNQYNQTPRGYPGPQPVVNLPQIPLETSFTKVYDKPRDVVPYYPPTEQYQTAPITQNQAQRSQKIEQSPQPLVIAPQQVYQPRTEVPSQFYQSPKIQQSPQSPPEIPGAYYQSSNVQQSPQLPSDIPHQFYQPPNVQQSVQSPVFEPQPTYQPRAEVPPQYYQSPSIQQIPQSPQYYQSPKIQQSPQPSPFVQQKAFQHQAEVPPSYYQSPIAQQSQQPPVFVPQQIEDNPQYYQSPKIQQSQQQPAFTEAPAQQHQSPKVVQQSQPPSFIPKTETTPKYRQQPLTSLQQQAAPKANKVSKKAAQPKPKAPAKSESVSQSTKSQNSSSTYTQQQFQTTATSASSAIQTLQINNAGLCKQASLDGRKRVQSQSQLYEKVEEVRRKSLGNVLEITRLEREAREQKAAAIKQDMYSVQQDVYSQKVKAERKTEIHKQETHVYKSSAPDDTPDIVKSSLAKDDIPILKKFGPPQRHCYIPNAYQNPLTKSETTASTQRPKPSQRKFSDPSVTRGPVIVEVPATPQPDSQDEIPRNIVFNNVSAFTSMSHRFGESSTEYTSHQSRPNKLSKCDSWHQICQLQNAAKPPSPKFNNTGTTNALRRSKSGHTLALPKLYEAGYDRTQISEKQKTVEAYFTGQKSPNSLSRNSSQTNLADETTTVSVKKSSINRIRTSEKASISKQNPSSGLSRSHTMPHIPNVSLLDESNVEDAFEQLMNGLSTTTTEKTETKKEDGGVVTTTTKVTTRTITGAPKPVSPFAKFQQLDKQSSLQSPKSPLTPTTPGGSSSTPIFRFTDPALNARAATVKDQLLQWCQSKTQEYENVQITNFSASWTDGLAFCALIHHFLPDAFDYSKLTPKQRRYNFELAFRVADEKAGIAPLLDVEDMVVMKRPDWKCVFTYVQSIYRRFRNCQ